MLGYLVSKVTIFWNIFLEIPSFIKLLRSGWNILKLVAFISQVVRISFEDVKDDGVAN